MDHIVSYILLTVLVMLGMYAPKNRTIKCLIIGMVFIFIAFSHDTHDLIVYRSHYNIIGRGGTSDYETLFVIAAKIGNRLGLDYYQFRGILAVIELTVLNHIISKRTEYSTYVWTLYLIFSAIYDATLLRFFMGMIFALLALEIINTRKRYTIRETIMYFVWIVLAALSHSSYWLLLLILPLSLVGNKTKLIIIIVMTLGVFFGGFIDVIRDVYSSLLIREYTVEKYFGGDYANINGLIFNNISQVIFMLPAIITYIWTRRNKVGDLISVSSIAVEETQKEVNMWMTINILFCVILPVQLIAVNFGRHQRMLAIINYIYISRMISVFPEKRRMFQWMGLLYAAFLLFFTMVIASDTNIEIVWNTMFELNTVFKWLG